jgi:competence protein ComEA
MQRLAIGPILMAVALAAIASAQVEAAATASAAPAASAPVSPQRLVDINRAGREELMTLPGVGAAEADRIIANRPYLTKTELVTKQVLPIGPYMSLKNKVVAMQNNKPVTGHAGSTGRHR